MARAPGMMHIPMRFTFSKEVVDERAIMSKGADPVHHRMVLDTAPKQIQSMDVDFADASGKVFKSTYFEFDLRRDGGYFEAGEYVVSLSGPDGDVGGSQKLTLTGDNPPVYRGAMDFASGDSGKKKKNSNIQDVSSGLDGGQQVASNDDDCPAARREHGRGGRGQRRQHGARGARTTRRPRKRRCRVTRAAAVAWPRAAVPHSVWAALLGLRRAAALMLGRRRRDKRDRA